MSAAAYSGRGWLLRLRGSWLLHPIFPDREAIAQARGEVISSRQQIMSLEAMRRRGLLRSDRKHSSPDRGRCRRTLTPSERQGFRAWDRLDRPVDTEGHEVAAPKGARGLMAANPVHAIQLGLNKMNVIYGVLAECFFNFSPPAYLPPVSREGIGILGVCSSLWELFAHYNTACVLRALDPHWLLPA